MVLNLFGLLLGQLSEELVRDLLYPPRLARHRCTQCDILKTSFCGIEDLKLFYFLRGLLLLFLIGIEDLEEVERFFRIGENLSFYLEILSLIGD